MQFEEITDTIKGKLYERIGNPLLFSYSILFLGINWKFIYLLILSENIVIIDRFLKENPLDYHNPLLYSIAYTFITPLFSLISETYGEFIKSGTLYFRNYMRKNWQEHELATIKTIEDKYKSRIIELEDRIKSETKDYMILEECILNWYRFDKKLPSDSKISLFHCAENLVVGDVAINSNGNAIRSTSGNLSVLGIVMYKPGKSYAIILEKGKFTKEILNIAERQNVNGAGKYYLSKSSPSRLEKLFPEIKGDFHIIGSLEEDGSFTVQKLDFTNR